MTIEPTQPCSRCFCMAEAPLVWEFSATRIILCEACFWLQHTDPEAFCTQGWHKDED